MTLETSRLLLRPMTLEDAERLHTIYSDPETMRYYPHPFSWEDTQRWIRWNLRNYEIYGFGLWAVTLRDSGLLIGDCGITQQRIDGDLCPEIGYHIHRDWQNRGYATEAAQACRVYALETLGLSAVYSYMRQNNVPSRRVAEKNGMWLLKLFRDAEHSWTVVYVARRDPRS